MALSVSAFPEHIQARHPNDVLATGDDGNSRNVVNTPRILGFFGAVSSASTNRKPETQSSPRLNPRDDEADGLSSPAVGASTATVPNSPAFQLPLAQEYEKSIEFEEQQWQSSSRRHPFPRKTSPSPIRLGPSNRLEFGVASRTLPLPTQLPSKSSPSLSHIPQQWSSNESSSSAIAHAGQSSRPLPIVPSPTSESFKPGSLSSPGSLVVSKPMSSIIVPSRSASAVAGSSKHTSTLPSSPNFSNNIAGPPRQLGNPSRQASPPCTAPPIVPPLSKVLIRGHRANSTSVSMRYYQPLFVDPQSAPDTSPASSPPRQNTILAPRPLPRVPPSLTAINFGLPASANPIAIAHAPLKRPRTSPSSFSGFSGLGTSSSSSAIPSSWASKPSSSRPSSPPSAGTCLRTPTTTVRPRRPPALKMPRARSWSRTRREKSLDSYTRLSSGISRTPPSSAGLATSFALSAGVNRSLTVGRYVSPPLGGARPLIKKPTLTHTITGRRDSLSARPRSGETTSTPTSSTLSRNTTLRHIRPQSPPSGPVLRTKSVKAASATTALPPPRQTKTPPPKAVPQTRPIPADIANLEASSTESLHIHPISTSFGDDESSRVSTSTLGSPLEFFVDGPETDASSINRSPSPIRYALPSSNAESSDWDSTNDEATTDDDLEGVSSSTSNSRSLAAARRRAQLKSYRVDCKPQMQDRTRDSDGKRNFWHDSPPLDATTLDLPKTARALPLPLKSVSKEKKMGKEENKKKDKWSFGDFTSIGYLSSSSTPGTRASSPERKGRSRQPRRLAEAVSALGSGRRPTDPSSGRGSVSGPSRPFLFSGLSSPGSHPNGGRPGGVSVPAEYEVLDIRVPSDEEVPRNDSNSLSAPLDYRIRSEPGSPCTPAFMKRSPIAGQSSRGSFASESSQGDVLWVTKEGKQSGLRDATSLMESRIIFRSPSDDDREEDIPFMWLSRDKPPEQPTPVPMRHGPGYNRHSELAEGSDYTSSKSPSQEVFPTMIPPIRSVGRVPLSPLSVSGVYPVTREGRNDEGRKQRTTSGPSRFDSTGSSSVRNISTAQDLGIRTREADDDIYCDERPREEERMVIKSRRVMDRGRYLEESRETQVVDVIPKLRSLKMSR